MFSRMFRQFSWSVSAALCVAALSAGCQPGVTTVSGPGEKSAEEKVQRCHDLMQSVLFSLELQKLDVATDVESTTQLINQWQSECGAASQFNPVPEALKGKFSAEVEQSLVATRLSSADADHLRHCVMMKALSRHAPGKASSSLDQVASVFDVVMRLVELDREAMDVPLTAYDVCLIGSGSPAHRAWVFAEVLRQLSFDAVILSPGGEPAKEDKPPFLVGVLLKVDGKEQVLLFDPLRGVALRKGAEPASPVASLADVAGNAEILTGLPPVAGWGAWTADSLKQPRVGVIGSEGFWSARFLALQPQFTGEHTMAVADPLTDTETGPGLWGRVVGGGKFWKATDVFLWEFPDTQFVQKRTPTPEQKAKRQAALLPLSAPVPILRDYNNLAKMDPISNLAVFGTPHREEFRGRLSQLDGEIPTAVMHYQVVRVESNKLPLQTPMEEKFKILHARAGEDARFFTAQCQFDRGQYRSARDTLEHYIANYPEGHWLNASRRLLALTLAANKQTAEAITLLKALPADGPHAAWVQQTLKSLEATKPAG